MAITIAKKNARELKKLKKQSTQRGIFMLQHTISDVVEPFQYTQVIFPNAWQGIFRSDIRAKATDPASVTKTPSFHMNTLQHVGANRKTNIRSTFSVLLCHLQDQAAIRGPVRSEHKKNGLSIYITNVARGDIGNDFYRGGVKISTWGLFLTFSRASF
jgi:hypothetical protein